MKIKNYIYLLITFFTFLCAYAQEKKFNTSKTDKIEGLQIYPNPATSGRIYISTENNSQTKTIEIYDMLGKKVFEATLNSNNKEINIANLTAGIYLIKIKENNNSETRKLVIK